jgi:SAM-dependent methyltransferase
MRSRATISSLAFYISLGAVCAQQQGPPPQVAIRAPYVRTPPEVVREMLKLAKVNRNDVVYDLGCGDGRIVIAAVREFGARGVGIDVEAERIREARANARKAGVADRVEFRQQDLFEADISEATVVTLYLLRDVNLELRPKLLRELKAGTRIVSHSFDMGDWKPDKELQVNGSKLYYWVVPEKASSRFRP